MAAVTSKFNLECVIQYYTDQWISFSFQIWENAIRSPLPARDPIGIHYELNWYHNQFETYMLLP